MIKKKSNNRIKNTAKRECVCFQFWTGTFYCGGCEVGGSFVARLTANEIAMLKDVAKKFGSSSESFEEKLPKLYNRLLSMSYTAFDIQMAKEAYPYYKDEYKEIFKGLSSSQRIAYVRKHAAEKVENMFHLKVENPY